MIFIHMNKELSMVIFSLETFYTSQVRFIKLQASKQQKNMSEKVEAADRKQSGD